MKRPDKAQPVTVDGGDHVWANLQCLCYQCNSRKGARFCGQQLRLF